MQQDQSFNALHQALGSSIKHNGTDYLYFGGTAYLGIPNNGAFLDLYVKGIKAYGLNNGTSRNNNVQLGIYSDAEKFAANKFGAAAALITSSGYLAAQLSVKKMAEFGEVIYSPVSHPALWIDQKPAEKRAFSEWTRDVMTRINESKQDNWVIISNSMNNLMPEKFDFSFVEHIDEKKEVVLIVDDSHGIGINNKGLGAFFSIPKPKNIEILVVASMAKALGVDAGLVLGSEKMIATLKQTDTFLGASPPAAAGLFAFMNANQIYTDELVKLRNNMLLLNKKLKGNKEWHFIKDFPVYLSKNAELSERLVHQQILVSSFAYPDKDGPKINRIVLSSWHTDAEIERLINAL